MRKLFEIIHTLEMHAKFYFLCLSNQAVMESAAALGNAKNARDAVSDTLKTITDIMSSLGEL